MTGTDRDDKRTGRGEKDACKSGKDPEWAQGLKRLYNSVVEEPLPDDLANLLSRLDADGSRK